jgi:hypothetical protein
MYQTTNPELLRKVMNGLTFLVDGNLTFSNAGLEVVGLTQEVYAHLTLPPNGAQKFECSDAKLVHIGQNFKRLAAALGTVKKGQIVSLTYDSANPKKELTFAQWDENFSHNFPLPVLNCEPVIGETTESGINMFTFKAADVKTLIQAHQKLGATAVEFKLHFDSQARLTLHSEEAGTTYTTGFVDIEGKTVSGPAFFSGPYNIKTLIGLLNTACSITKEITIAIDASDALVMLVRLGAMGRLEYRVKVVAAEEEQPKSPVEVENATSPLKRKAATAKKAEQPQAKKPKTPPNPSQRCDDCAKWFTAGVNVNPNPDSDEGAGLCDECYQKVMAGVLDNEEGDEEEAEDEMESDEDAATDTEPLDPKSEKAAAKESEKELKAAEAKQKAAWAKAAAAREAKEAAKKEGMRKEATKVCSECGLRVDFTGCCTCCGYCGYCG